MLNKKCIEIDITLRCNLHCPNCDRMAPKNIDLQLEYLKQFVAEKRKWKKIILIGGEPTLHPQLKEIFKIIEAYKYESNIAIATNGYKNKELLKLVPSWIAILNSNKTSSDQLFKTFNVAPIDVGFTKGFERGCYIADFCGIAMSVDGLYYPCAPGATVAREFRFEIGQKSVDDVNTWMFDKVCRYCGHFKYDTGEYGTKEKYKKACVREQVYSKSWLDRKGLSHSSHFSILSSIFRPLMNKKKAI